MRVIEPHELRRRKSANRWPYICLMVVLVAVFGVGALKLHDHSYKTKTALSKTLAVPVIAAKKPTTVPKTFTGNDFKNLYRSVMQTYPNTETFPQMPEITGNPAADQHIRELAEARGFRPTRIPVTALIKTNEPLLKGETDDLLQPAAFQAWQQIKESAKKDNVPLTIISAFRSPEWQRNLFMQRLLAKGVSVDQIASGNADSAVAATLSLTAVPGYSRHHTGYTVDFWCEDGSGDFGSSKCFKWLNDNNYLHAKTYGWIPSYPAGADEQGPEPEPWEYVWVGKDLLFQ